MSDRDQFRCTICTNHLPFSTAAAAEKHVRVRHAPLLADGLYAAGQLVALVDPGREASIWATVSRFRDSLRRIVTARDFADACFDADRGRTPPVGG